jgi:hypothetical protein
MNEHDAFDHFRRCTLHLVRERVRSGKTLSVGLLWRAERIVRSEERKREAQRRSTDEHIRKRAYIKHFEDRYKR